ncbi:MAG: 2-oxoglutarate and iron-dependent oxygenase domain-containing protein [Gammaproteobacteria bacterium]|nr:2-oxoglutarate and iron-dependent oxygenase domain-containing protein [Gammaproteobacteria bacterium]
MSFAQTDNGVLSIPLIDIGGFNVGLPTQRGEIAAKVDHAARRIDFTQITGHGIPESAITDLAAAIDGCFGLPLGEKMKTRPSAVDINRGYSSPPSERLTPAWVWNPPWICLKRSIMV